jgi:MFS family permease
MSNSVDQRSFANRTCVFGAVSLIFFFLNVATFTSLGVVLYTMVAELHWSMTAAGFSFTLLGVACGLSSPLPALTMKRLGGRATVCLGTLILAVGFYLASISDSIMTFYVAMVLLGIGYSLAGNVPAVYLIGAWYGRASARVIGFYLMLGALGAAFGPPLVEVIVSDSGGWRGHWRIMAWTSAAIGVVCFALIRDAEVVPESDGQTDDQRAAQPSEWSPRQAIFTPQFFLITAAMAATMTCVTTNSSIALNHLVNLGATPATGALILSVIAITATVVKGIAGRMCETVPPPYILAAGLVLQGVGSALLAIAHTTVLQYAGALTFGAGWGLAYVAATVVLLDYFGLTTGAKILSIVWLLTTVAAAGPLLAGMIADRYGTFAPTFDLYAGMMIVLAIPVVVMREPSMRPNASSSVGYREG